MAEPGLWVLGTFLVFISSIAVVGISAILQSDTDFQSRRMLTFLLLAAFLVLAKLAWFLNVHLVSQLSLYEVDAGKATWGDLKNNVRITPIIIVIAVSDLTPPAIALSLTIPAYLPLTTVVTELIEPANLGSEVIVVILLPIIILIFLARIINGLIQPLFGLMAWYAVSGQAGIGAAIKAGFRIGRTNYLKLLMYGFVMGSFSTFFGLFTFGLGQDFIIKVNCLSQAHLFRQMAGNVPVNKG